MFQPRLIVRRPHAAKLTAFHPRQGQSRRDVRASDDNNHRGYRLRASKPTLSVFRGNVWRSPQLRVAHVNRLPRAGRNHRPHTPYGKLLDPVLARGLRQPPSGPWSEIEKAPTPHPYYLQIGPSHSKAPSDCEPGREIQIRLEHVGLAAHDSSLCHRHE